MNAEYKPSAHLVSEQPQDAEQGVQIDGWVALWSAMLALAALIVCNFAPEPVSCDRPAQVQQK